MKKDDLFDAITQIDDRHIAHAERHRFRPPFAWQRWGALAAAFVLVAGAAHFVPRGGSSGSGASDMMASGATAGSAENAGARSDAFGQYNAPVLPLTIDGAWEELELSRELTFDFGTEDSYFEQYAASAAVTDFYTLTNPTDTALTLTLSYPCGGTLQDSLPQITVDGEAVETDLLSGDYLGGFTENGWNLDAPHTVEPYAALLETTEALEAAQTPAAPLDTPVTIYTFQNVSHSDVDAATLQYRYTCDPARTTVLSYGFNGFSGNENGVQAHDFFLYETRFSPIRQLIVVGDDIESGSLQGYQNGTCTPGEELDGLTCTVTRTETTLDEALRALAEDCWNEAQSLEYPAMPHRTDAPVTFELYFDAVRKYFAAYSPLGESPVERYEDGRLEDLLQEVLLVDRVLWQSFAVTIPAGETCTVEAAFVQKGSFNYVCGQTDGLFGYDLLTIAPAEEAWPTTLRLVNTDHCADVSCALTTTGGFVDALDLAGGDTILTLSPATGYHAFILREK